MHFKPPALLLGTLGLFFLMPLVVDAANEKGLILRLGSPDGSSDARVARSVALHVPSGQSPSPFLKAGSFTARWEGKLVLEKRSRLVFHLEGRGQAKLLIDGEVLVEAIGSSSESERLRSGEHEFLVEYIPPPEGEATLQLWWEGREFGKEPMPANVFRHDPEDKVLQRQSSFRRGRMLVAEKRCGSCHDSGTEEMMPELRLQAPSLDDIGNRLQADWLVRWISNPESLRPHARMPAVFHGEDAQQKAAHIAAYLVAGGSHPEKNDEHSPGEIREGGKIFHQQGCIACHTLDRKGDGERIGLGGVRQKFRQGALAGFLQKPSKFHEGTRMPSFRFSAKEAASVASFLRSLGEEPEEEPLRGDPARGQMLARSTGCFNCHQRKGEKAAEVSKLGLFELGSAECSGVDYNLSEDEKGDLGRFLGEKLHEESLGRFVPAEFSGRQYHALRCNACHARDGEESLRERYAGEVANLLQPDPAGDEEKPGGLSGPPPLDHLGMKLRTDWRTRLFAGEIHPKIRRWLPARMPAFPARAGDLSLGFSHAVGRSGKGSGPFDPDPEQIGIGESMTGVAGGLSCGTCHGIGEKPPIAVFEGEGPNLRAAGERLTRDYFHLWMNDPPRVWPGTIMPKYALDGKTPLTQYYEGDARKQFEAVYQYLRSLSEKQDHEKKP